MGNGLRPSATPTSRAAPGLPMRRAISPYVMVEPGGISRAATYTSRSKSGSPLISSRAAPRSMRSPRSNAVTRSIRVFTSTGGSASRASGNRRRSRARNTDGSRSGSCTPRTPCSFHPMPHVPIAVSNSAKAMIAPCDSADGRSIVVSTCPHVQQQTKASRIAPLPGSCGYCPDDGGPIDGSNDGFSHRGPECPALRASPFTGHPRSMCIPRGRTHRPIEPRSLSNVDDSTRRLNPALREPNRAGVRVALRAT
jgi:hypothetical protein